MSGCFLADQMMSGTDHASVTRLAKEPQLGPMDEARKATFKRYWDVVTAIGKLADQSRLLKEPAHWETVRQMYRHDRFGKAACSVDKKQYAATTSTSALRSSLLTIRCEMREILVRCGVHDIHEIDYGAPRFPPVFKWLTLEQVLARHEPYVLGRRVQNPMRDDQIDKIRWCFLTPVLACLDAFKTQLAVVIDLAEWIDKVEHGPEIFFVELKVFLRLKEAVQLMEATAGQ